jgi:hypothetical protein
MMRNGNRRDVVRQAANVVGAVLQFAVPTLTFRGDAITRLDARNPSLVVPGDYAFTIWGVIFALSLAYAVYQALPANRESALLRRVGPFTAAAFALNALWCALVPAGQFFASLVVLVGILAFLALAFAALVRTARERSLGTVERWLVALPLGPFFGWITTANTVSLPSGIVQAGSPAEALLGGSFLILGGLLASAVVLVAGRSAPATFYLTYGLAVLWGLTGVIAAQFDRSFTTTGAAALSAVVLGLVLLRVLRGNGSRSGAGRIARARVV